MRRSAVPLALTLTTWLFLSPSHAAAQTRLFVPCPSGVPCETDVYGYIDAYGTARLPWVASVIAPAGVCLYPEIISGDNGASLLRSIIAPNGTVYRTKDIGIAVSPTIAGWYTLQFDAVPPTKEQIFQVRIHELPAGNCPNPTPGK
jgi:hypothetical protein